MLEPNFILKMSKWNFHPKAFLLRIKNVNAGLTARTRIATLLEKEAMNASEISEKSGLSYSSVLHHLHLMEKERIVARSDKRPYKWRLTGAGQKRLIEVFKE